jgi:hypothetical protein
MNNSDRKDVVDDLKKVGTKNGDILLNAATTMVEEMLIELKIMETALDDISSGRGMFGLVAEEDLKWAMGTADRALKVVLNRRVT